MSEDRITYRRQAKVGEYQFENGQWVWSAPMIEVEPPVDAEELLRQMIVASMELLAYLPLAAALEEESNAFRSLDGVLGESDEG